MNKNDAIQSAMNDAEASLKMEGQFISEEAKKINRKGINQGNFFSRIHRYHYGATNMTL